MTNTALSNYVTCLYYLCKTKVHDKYLHLCNVIPSAILSSSGTYVEGQCNCLTEQYCDGICNAIINFKTSQPLNRNTTPLSCKPVEKNPNKFFDYYVSAFGSNNIISYSDTQSLSYEDIANLRSIIDVYVCCAALSNCKYPTDSILDFIDRIEKIAVDYDRCLDISSVIQKYNKEEEKEFTQCIFKSIEILNQLSSELKIVNQDYSISTLSCDSQKNIKCILKTTDKLIEKENDDLIQINNQLAFGPNTQDDNIPVCE